MKSIISVISKGKGYKDINKDVFNATGIVDFFEDDLDKNEFLNFYNRIDLNINDIKEREFGDYQTPLSLTDRICEYLISQGCNPEMVIEPTFGKGNFIQSSLKYFNGMKELYGVEIQKKYIGLSKFLIANNALNSATAQKTKINLIHDSIFNYTFKTAIKSKEFLIIGNPPWVTNAELSSIDSNNLPRKSNFKEHKGLEAITGKGNFDICEYIIIQLMERFHSYHGVFAMLCKNSVAKNIIHILPKRDFNISDIKLLGIDTKKEFNASTEASLLYFKFGEKSNHVFCKTYSLYEPYKQIKTFGWYGDKFVSDVDKYSTIKEIDNISSLVWRSGIKHDSSRIMELSIKGNDLINGLKETVDVEDTFVYKLFKSSDIKGGVLTKHRKAVIITQKRIGQDTSHIEGTSPRLWDYLIKNRKYLDKRKSSIYKGKPQFSIFGVGCYSFSPYKIAISGMYKVPNFSLIIPSDGKPVMLDDTCYFLGFDNKTHAIFMYLVLNRNNVQDFLQSIVFQDEKRPYTKDILMRIDLVKCLNIMTFNDVKQEYNRHHNIPKITFSLSDWNTFKEYVNNDGMNVKKELQLTLDI